MKTERFHCCAGAAEVPHWFDVTSGWRCTRCDPPPPEEQRCACVPGGEPCGRKFCSYTASSHVVAR